jgi:predicted RNA-binding Zn-ribbon protein involved in translation (DUF1610 family)
VARKIILVRAALPVTCPSCGAAISWRHAAADVHFLCPECGHGVRLRGGYFRVLKLVSLLVVGLAAYALGARGEVLLWTTIIGGIPAGFVLTFVTMRLFPPDTESTGDYRGILYGVHGREPHVRKRTEGQNAERSDDVASNSKADDD